MSDKNTLTIDALDHPSMWRQKAKKVSQQKIINSN